MNETSVSPLTTQQVRPPVEQRPPPQAIKTNLMDKFSFNLQQLDKTITANRFSELNRRERPLITVVVSLWEEDYSMLASKMFSHSLLELQNQATASGMDLDLIIVANNGGGKTEELGNDMVKDLSASLQMQFNADKFHLLETNKPANTDIDSATPWELEMPLAGPRDQGQNRCFLVGQPHDGLNAGKIRALRDASHAMHKEVLKGYTPDAVFQMDAETILEYKNPILEKVIPPLKTMYNTLKRKEAVVAVGTKVRKII